MIRISCADLTQKSRLTGNTCVAKTDSALPVMDKKDRSAKKNNREIPAQQILIPGFRNGEKQEQVPPLRDHPF